MSFSNPIQMKNRRRSIRSLADEYLPLSGSVGGLAGGIILIDISGRTGNGWLFLAGLFSLFYAAFYYRWVTGVLISPRGREE